MRPPFLNRLRGRDYVRLASVAGLAACALILLPLTSCGGSEGISAGTNAGSSKVLARQDIPSAIKYASSNALRDGAIPGGAIIAPAYRENTWAELNIADRASEGLSLCFGAQHGNNSVMTEYWGPSAGKSDRSWHAYAPGAGGSKARFRSKIGSQAVEYRFVRSESECPLGS